jgi:hypothetical protein
MHKAQITRLSNLIANTAMSKPPHHFSTVILTLVLLIGATITFTQAKPSKPLDVSIVSPVPSNAISLIDVCHIKVQWVNSEPRNSYKGSFVFTVTCKNIKLNSADVTFTFKGVTITAQESHGVLLFYLPQQTFRAGKSGTISVDVVYNKPGRYNWEIGIAQR